MSGFWVGFNESLDKQLDRGLKEKLFNAEKNEQRKARMLELTGKRLERERERMSSASRLNAATMRLEQYGVDSEVIEGMRSTGDLEGMEKVIGELDGLTTGYEEQGRPVPTNAINSYLEGVVLAPATVERVDLTGIDLSDFYDYGYTDEDIEAMTTFTSPGTISAKPPVVVEQPSLEDLSRVERMAIGNAADRAAGELKSINRALGVIMKDMEAGGDQFTEADQEAVLSRQMQIKEAIDMSQGDNPVYAPLVSLYGKQYFDNILASYPQFSNSPFSPAFTESFGQNPFEVEDPAQAQRLFRLGAIREGDVIYIKSTDEYRTATR